MLDNIFLGHSLIGQQHSSRLPVAAAISEEGGTYYVIEEKKYELVWRAMSIHRLFSKLADDD